MIMKSLNKAMEVVEESSAYPEAVEGSTNFQDFE